MVAVFPLIGLRLMRNPKVDEPLLSSEEAKHRFAIIPQNKNFTPNENAGMGSAVVLCKSDEDLEKWIEIIEETVDEEEHNVRPCNPVDLEKRLRGEKTSPEGRAPTITINDPAKVEEMRQWKELKESGKLPKKVKPPPVQIARIPPKGPARPPPLKQSGSGPPRAPATASTGNTPISSPSGSGGPPPRPPSHNRRPSGPPSKPPPRPGSKGGPSRKPPPKGGPPAPRLSTGRPSGPPPSGPPGRKKPPNSKSAHATRGPPPKFHNPPPKKHSEPPKPAVGAGRVSLLAGISGYVQKMHAFSKNSIRRT